MAAGTASLLTGGLGAGMGLFQAITGKNNERDAERALNNYERQSLDNAYKNIQISTLGSDIQREESQRNAASLFDILQGGGARSIVGGIPKVVGSLNNVNQQIAKDLDQQFINREYAIAGDNARIEGMIENRDNQNIAALSSQANAGRQDFFNGLMGVGSAAAYMGRNITPGENATVDPATGMNSAGITSPIGSGQMPGTPTASPITPITTGPMYGASPTPMPFANTPYFYQGMPQPIQSELSADYFGNSDLINKYPRF